MNWTYFDERTPDDGQLIIAANLKGARQFWLWQSGYDMETMKILEMDFWCPVPDLPKPPDPFEDFWKQEQMGPAATDWKSRVKRAFDAGLQTGRKLVK